MVKQDHLEEKIRNPDYEQTAYHFEMLIAHTFNKALGEYLPSLQLSAQDAAALSQLVSRDIKHHFESAIASIKNDLTSDDFAAKIAQKVKQYGGRPQLSIRVTDQSTSTNDLAAGSPITLPSSNPTMIHQSTSTLSSNNTLSTGAQTVDEDAPPQILIPTGRDTQSSSNNHF